MESFVMGDSISEAASASTAGATRSSGQARGAVLQTTQTSKGIRLYDPFVIIRYNTAPQNQT